MATFELDGLKVAILATDGVEQVELTEPRRALEQAGAQVWLVSPRADRVQGYHHLDRGDTFEVDYPLGEADPERFDALVLPGGVANPDALRMDPEAVLFVRHFFAAGKPVGAICHAAWLLIEADVVRQRRLTSWPSLRTDVINAGGTWEDAEVVTDGGLVTSRKPADLPAFNRKLIEEIREGVHQSAQTSAGEPAARGAAGGVVSGDPGLSPPEGTVDNPDAAVDTASADSYPASDAPSSYQTT